MTLTFDRFSQKMAPLLAWFGEFI